jgi:hypothetical protein
LFFRFEQQYHICVSSLDGAGRAEKCLKCSTSSLRDGQQILADNPSQPAYVSEQATE